MHPPHTSQTERAHRIHPSHTGPTPIGNAFTDTTMVDTQPPRGHAIPSQSTSSMDPEPMTAPYQPAEPPNSPSMNPEPKAALSRPSGTPAPTQPLHTDALPTVPDSPLPSPPSSTSSSDGDDVPSHYPDRVADVLMATRNRQQPVGMVTPGPATPQGEEDEPGREVTLGVPPNRPPLLRDLIISSESDDSMMARDGTPLNGDGPSSDGESSQSSGERLLTLVTLAEAVHAIAETMIRSRRRRGRWPQNL